MEGFEYSQQAENNDEVRFILLSCLLLPFPLTSLQIIEYYFAPVFLFLRLNYLDVPFGGPHFFPPLFLDMYL